MTGPVRLGLIGVGRWGRNILRSAPALAAVSSRNPETAALLPPGCQLFSDWRAMLSDGGLDGVIIATPPALHAKMALAAIECGLPLLMEKPLTMDVAEAERVADAARRAGVPVMVDHIHLYNAPFRRMLELAPSLGRKIAIQSRAGNRGPYRDVPVLWDWGPHDVAMAMALAGGPPQRAAARLLNCAPVEGGVAETVELGLEFADGLGARAVIGTQMDRTRILSLHAEGGSMTYDDLAPNKLTLWRAGSPLPEAVSVQSEPPLDCLLREFAAMVAGRTAADGGLELGVEVVRVLAAAAADLNKP